MFYEIHLTVGAKSDGSSQNLVTKNLLQWKLFCDDVRAKMLLIELHSKGNKNLPYPQHLMLAKSKDHENDLDAALWLDNVRKKAGDAGFVVDRSKLESEISTGVGAYYEIHWKVDIVGSEVPGIMDFTERYPQIRYSNNMLNGNHYLTARYYEYHPNGAAEYFQALTDVIAHRYPILKSHMERVLSDDCPTLDSGWAYAC